MATVQLWQMQMPAQASPVRHRAFRPGLPSLLDSHCQLWVPVQGSFVSRTTGLLPSPAARGGGTSVSTSTQAAPGRAWGWKGQAWLPGDSPAPGPAAQPGWPLVKAQSRSAEGAEGRGAALANPPTCDSVSRSGARGWTSRRPGAIPAEDSPGPQAWDAFVGTGPHPPQAMPGPHGSRTCPALDPSSWASSSSLCVGCVGPGLDRTVDMVSNLPLTGWRGIMGAQWSAVPSLSPSAASPAQQSLTGLASPQWFLVGPADTGCRGLTSLSPGPGLGPCLPGGAGAALSGTAHQGCECSAAGQLGYLALALPPKPQDARGPGSGTPWGHSPG